LTPALAKHRSAAAQKQLRFSLLSTLDLLIRAAVD
jgi:hypothetical protein